MNKIELNKDCKRRDEIIGRKGDGDYDIYGFEGMTLETLEKLFDENFINPEDAQNSAPSAGDILQFMRDNPRFTCNGYAVTINRNDYRVSIEGVGIFGKTTADEKEAFTSLFRWADEFTCNKNGCYCWFD